MREIADHGGAVTKEHPGGVHSRARRYAVSDSSCTAVSVTLSIAITFRSIR
jgi:hypothetical protein